MLTLIILIVLVITKLLCNTAPVHLNDDENKIRQELEEEDESSEYYEYEDLYSSLLIEKALRSRSTNKREHLVESHYSRGKSSKKGRHITLKRKAARESKYSYLLDLITD